MEIMTNEVSPSDNFESDIRLDKKYLQTPFNNKNNYICHVKLLYLSTHNIFMTMFGNVSKIFEITVKWFY